MIANDEAGVSLKTVTDIEQKNREHFRLKMEIDARFSINMELFRLNMPTIYEYYREYQPEKYFLIVDDNGNLNIASDGSVIYQEDPQKEISQQVDLFYQQPIRYSYYFDSDFDQVLTDHFLHVESLQAMAKTFEEESDHVIKGREMPASIESLVMMGCGLGYQMERLFQEKEIRNFFLYESEPDVFYASLFTVDWSIILSKVCRNDVLCKIIIGKEPKEFALEIQDAFDKRGYHRFTSTYFYRHYASPSFDMDVKRVMEEYYQLFAGWGFIDDELISVSHSLVNANENSHFFSSKSKAPSTITDLPVVIVGNGPSLDKDIDILRSMKDKVIIICAGCSTLKALHHYGIKPDFLTVIERTKGVVEWLDQVEDKGFLRDIRLITINNTHPEVIEHFSQYGLALKAADSGALFLKNYFENGDDVAMTLATPTGANAAVSFLISKGFTSCYMLGLDLGFRDPKKHHSKESAYFSKETGEDLNRFPNHESEHLQREANFGGIIYTDIPFDSSRNSLENLLRQNPNFQCWNTSDGIKIKYTEALNAEMIVVGEEIVDKTKRLDDLMAMSFPYVKPEGIDFYEEFADYLDQIESVSNTLITILDGVERLDQVDEAFKRQHDYVNSFFNESNRDRAIHFMFIGTIHHCQLVITRSLTLLDNDVSKSKVWDKSRVIFKDYLIRAVEKIKTQYGQVDTLTRFEKIAEASG